MGVPVVTQVHRVFDMMSENATPGAADVLCRQIETVRSKAVEMGNASG
ncbi:hypothetical protein CITRIK5_60259 [Citricoccus sp. K5]|nr:hypothetical protein CITRIK5_60259 [Citricoccus sp. K5]